MRLFQNHYKFRAKGKPPAILAHSRNLLNSRQRYKKKCICARKMLFYCHRLHFFAVTAPYLLLIFYLSALHLPLFSPSFAPYLHWNLIGTSLEPHWNLTMFLPRDTPDFQHLSPILHRQKNAPLSKCVSPFILCRHLQFPFLRFIFLV